MSSCAFSNPSSSQPSPGCSKTSSSVDVTIIEESREDADLSISSSKRLSYSRGEDELSSCAFDNPSTLSVKPPDRLSLKGSSFKEIKTISPDLVPEEIGEIFEEDEFKSPEEMTPVMNDEVPNDLGGKEEGESEYLTAQLNPEPLSTDISSLNYDSVVEGESTLSADEVSDPDINVIPSELSKYLGTMLNPEPLSKDLASLDYEEDSTVSLGEVSKKRDEDINVSDKDINVTVNEGDANTVSEGDVSNVLTDSEKDVTKTSLRTVGTPDTVIGDEDQSFCTLHSSFCISPLSLLVDPIARISPPATNPSSRISSPCRSPEPSLSCYYGPPSVESVYDITSGAVTYDLPEGAVFKDDISESSSHISLPVTGPSSRVSSPGQMNYHPSIVGSRILSPSPSPTSDYGPSSSPCQKDYIPSIVGSRILSPVSDCNSPCLKSEDTSISMDTIDYGPSYGAIDPNTSRVSSPVIDYGHASSPYQMDTSRVLTPSELDPCPSSGASSGIACTESDPRAYFGRDTPQGGGDNPQSWRDTPGGRDTPEAISLSGRETPVSKNSYNEPKINLARVDTPTPLEEVKKVKKKLTPKSKSQLSLVFAPIIETPEPHHKASSFLPIDKKGSFLSIDSSTTKPSSTNNLTSSTVTLADRLSKYSTIGQTSTSTLELTSQTFSSWLAKPEVCYYFPNLRFVTISQT